MNNSEDTQRKIIHRLKIAKGHLEKVIEMVDKDRYCVDILYQSKAVQNALQQADTVILNNHLNTCVIEDITSGKADKAIADIVKIFKSKS